MSVTSSYYQEFLTRLNARPSKLVMLAEPYVFASYVNADFRLFCADQVAAIEREDLVPVLECCYKGTVSNSRLVNGALPCGMSLYLRLVIRDPLNDYAETAVIMDGTGDPDCDMTRVTLDEMPTLLARIADRCEFWLRRRQVPVRNTRLRVLKQVELDLRIKRMSRHAAQLVSQSPKATCAHGIERFRLLDDECKRFDAIGRFIECARHVQARSGYQYGMAQMQATVVWFMVMLHLLAAMNAARRRPGPVVLTVVVI